MNDEATYKCDSCGEEVAAPIDPTAGKQQQYVEECPNCSCPNIVHVEIDEDGAVRAWVMKHFGNGTLPGPHRTGCRGECFKTGIETDCFKATWCTMPTKLYHGTSEAIAKMAPTVGIKAPEVVLTSVYGIYQSFMAAGPGERWALVEVLWDRLKASSLLPYTEFTPAKLQGKDRTWRKSLETAGFCLHGGRIPVQAIGKVWIYNPQSNWMITRTVLEIELGPENYAKDQKKLSIVNRWLTGDFIDVDEWLAEQTDTFTKEQIDEMRVLWADRSGLDIFYHGS
jgi:Cysteine-rich CPXCG